MLIQVSLSLNIYDHFTYEYNGDENTIKPGMRVIIPVGNRVTTGWVVATHSDYQKKVRNIIGIIDDFFLPDKTYMEFSKAVSSEYYISQGKVLDYSLSPGRKSLHHIYLKKNDQIEKLSKFSITDLNKMSKPEPLRFFYKLKCEYDPNLNNLVSNNRINLKNRFLLDYDRVDSYREIIKQFSLKNLCVLVTVPDNLSADFFKQKLENCETYHSKMKATERENLWCNSIHGKARLIVGGLSASLLPIKNLGCIISERSGSLLYKKTPFSDFNVNHLARLRAETFKIPFIQGFSTFTSEAYLNKKQLLIEDNRSRKEVVLEVRRLPKKEPGIPQILLELLKKYYLDKKKILVVINKKKSNTYLFCQKCKRIQYCLSCSGILNVDNNNINCSKCDFKTAQLKECTACGSVLVSIKDISINSLKEVIRKQLSEKGIRRITSEDLVDVTSILEQIKNTHITIATPAILNPYFKNIFDSIIYFRPESVLSMNEYSTGEMIFSMVSELKELIKNGGNIDIFSVFHFHYSLKLVQREGEFFNRELKYRKWFQLPPFCNVYILEIRSDNLRKLGSEMRMIYRSYKEKMNIKRIYLVTRKKLRGNFKGHIEIHSDPGVIEKSELLAKRNVSIKIVAL